MFLACVSFRAFPAAAGWAVGSALSFGTLRSLEVVVRRNFVPGKEGADKALAKFSLVKLPVVLLIIGLSVWLGGRSLAFIAWFCAGVVLTQSVVVLKVVGMLIIGQSSGQEGNRQV